MYGMAVWTVVDFVTKPMFLYHNHHAAVFSCPLSQLSLCLESADVASTVCTIPFLYS